LDFVGIILEIEDEFGICFNDEDFPAIITAGDLCQCVLSHESLQDSIQRAQGLTACPTVLAYLNLRRSLSHLTGCEKSLIRPRTEIDTILNRPDRRSVWSDVSRQSRIILPALELSRKASIIHRISWIVAIVGIMAALWPVLSIASLLVAPLVLIPCGCLIEMITSSHRTHIPPTCHTISEMLSHAKRTYVPRTFGANELTFDETWVRVQKILGEQLNIPLAEITPESRFIEDLRVD
jgi:acyl carrier protein